jgi:phosphoserine aminotransferase
LKWIKQSGGIDEISRKNQENAQLLYTFIQESKIYKCPVSKEYQSRMNIPFRIWTNEQVNQGLEREFLSLCKRSNLIGLSGHRSVGGIRASLYNAMPVSGVETLLQVMKEFDSNL